MQFKKVIQERIWILARLAKLVWYYTLGQIAMLCSDTVAEFVPMSRSSVANEQGTGF